MKTSKILKFTLLGFAFGVVSVASAQVKVGDNPASVNANAVLEIESTNKGLLLPRIALTNTTAFAPMTAHVEGMKVYNTATAGDVTPGIYYNDGAKWVRVAAGDDIKTEPWNVQGTTDEATINTDNIYQQGKVTIGSTSATPVTTKQLEVVGDFKTEYINGTTVKGIETNADGSSGTLPGSAMYGRNAVNFADATLSGQVGIYGDSQPYMNSSAKFTDGTNASSTIMLASISNMGSLMLMNATNPQENAEAKIQLNGYGATGLLTLSDEVNSGFKSEVIIQRQNGVQFKFRDASNADQGRYFFPRTSPANNQVLARVGTLGIIPQLGWVDASSLTTPTTNTLANDGTNTLTSTVDGVVATAPAVNTVVNTIATDALTTTVNGVASTPLDLSTLKVEPFNVSSTTTKATLNNQNIYQNGNIGIGDFSATNPIAKLDVRGAVRGGSPNLTATVGVNSVSFGKNTQATNENSFAIGLNSIASGWASFAIGANTTASSDQSVAMGTASTSSGNSSFAAGQSCTASGQASVAMGNTATASGQYSIALGGYATGNSSVAMGDAASASGQTSVALGAGSASGVNSVAMGVAAAASFGETSMGYYNAIITGTATSSVSTDALLQVGNGTNTVTTRNNALTILKNAHTAIGVNGIEATAKPTELLDLGGAATAGNGGLKIRNINTAAYTGDNTMNIVVADANGVLKTIPASTSVAISTKTANYTALPADETLLVDATSGSVTITLPATPVIGKKYNVKKIDSSSNTAVVDGNGKMIDGNASVSGSLPYQGWVMQYDGTAWFIISRI